MGSNPTRLAVLLAVSLVASASAQTATQPFVAGTSLVVVPASVVDQRGQAVTSLTQDDFEVRDDGQPVAITTFSAAVDGGTNVGARDGRFVMLLLDNRNVQPTDVWKVKEIAQRFVDKMSAHDTLGIMRVVGDRTVTTGGPVALKQAIQKFSSVGDPDQLEEWDRRRALEMIRSLTTAIAEFPHPRKVLVCVGAAALFNPEPAFEDPRDGQQARPDGVPEFSTSWTGTIADPSRHAVSVFVIDPAGGRDWRTPLSAHGGAQSLAALTGGEAFVHSSNYKSSVDRIWQDGGSYYLLGYAAPPTGGRPGRPHSIDVRVKRAGLTVRARQAR